MTPARRKALKGYKKGHFGWGATFSSNNMTDDLLSEGLICKCPEKTTWSPYFIITPKGIQASGLTK